MFRFESVGRTHPGLIRQINEDALLDRPELGLWVVADGMGGLADGELASRLVVEAFDAMPPADDCAACVQDVRARLAGTNGELRALANGRGTGKAMGSTVAGLLAVEDRFACFWAGDSRVYRLRRGELSRLTRDHSLVQDIIDAGLLDPQQAESHPHANLIHRAVGVDDTLELDVVQAQLDPDDVFLLCSDGLTRLVNDVEIGLELRRESLQGACDTLIENVLARGARDNVTVVLVRCLAG